jgi:hypothetical protein
MDENQEVPAIERRPSLDELFANEPFLSPTMKAKRLYDRIEDDNGDSHVPNAVVSEAIPTSVGYAIFPPRLEPQTAFAGTALISMTAARAIMGEQKDGGPPLPGEPSNISMLRALKDRMLSPWLRSIGTDF